MITVIFTILSAIYDNGKRFQDHSSRFIFRAVVVGLISFFEDPTILIGVWEPTLLQFALNTAIFYLIFDYTLNILEGRKWNYIGSTAKIDLMWRKLGGWIPQFIFKLIFLIITIKLEWILKFLENTLFG
jgi:hypothetical protein